MSGPHLAQALTSHSSELIWLTLWMALGLLLIGLVAFGLRRWITSRPNTSDAAGNEQGFSLAQLRQMHQNGQLSDQEFAKAKARSIGDGSPDSPPLASTPPDQPPR